MLSIAGVIGADFVAIDEIQLCADEERGHTFTDRLLYARGREETMFMGADSMARIIRRLLREAVSRIERGKVMPTIERLAELAMIFGCETAELLTEGSSRPEDQARRLHDLLATLSTDDRQLVMGLVESLVERLGRS